MTEVELRQKHYRLGFETAHEEAQGAWAICCILWHLRIHEYYSQGSSELWFLCEAAGCPPLPTGAAAAKVWRDWYRANCKHWDDVEDIEGELRKIRGEDE